MFQISTGFVHVWHQKNQLLTSPEVVWLYPDGRGASVVVPEAAAEESAEIRLLRKM